MLQYTCANDELIRLNKFISRITDGFYNLFFYFYQIPHTTPDITTQDFNLNTASPFRAKDEMRWDFNLNNASPFRAKDEMRWVILSSAGPTANGNRLSIFQRKKNPLTPFVSGAGHPPLPPRGKIVNPACPGAYKKVPLHFFKL